MSLKLDEIDLNEVSERFNSPPNQYETFLGVVDYADALTRIASATTTLNNSLPNNDRELSKEAISILRQATIELQDFIAIRSARALHRSE